MLCEENGCHHYKNALLRFANWLTEFSSTILTSTYVWVNQLPSGVFSSSANTWLKYLGTDTWEGQILMMFNAFFKCMMRDTDSLTCWVALIVCTKNEKNCLVAWKGQFTWRHRSPTLVLEAVASHDLWIWHAFFGVVGSRNDINVLYESPIFNNVLQGNEPEINFTVNGSIYKGLLSNRWNISRVGYFC